MPLNSHLDTVMSLTPILKLMSCASVPSSEELMAKKSGSSFYSYHLQEHKPLLEIKNKIK